MATIGHFGRSRDTRIPVEPDEVQHNVYYYPGGTIGGPIIVPGTSFNKDRKKFFFWTGFEYFYQVLDTGLLRATVPTPGELGGDFSPAEVAKEGNITASGKAPGN